MSPLRSLISYVRGHLSPGRFGRHLSQYMLQIGVETGSRTISTFIVAGIFSAALFGQLGVLLTFVNFLLMVADGSCAAMVKFTAEARTRSARLGAEVGWRGAWLSAAAALAGGAAIFAGVEFFSVRPKSATGIVMILAWILTAAWILKVSLEAAFRGLKDFAPPAMWALATAPAMAMALIAAAWSGGRLAAYMAIMAAGVGVNAAGLAAHYHARHRRVKDGGGELFPGGNFSGELRALIRAMIRYSTPLMMRGAIWFFFLKVNILIVAIYQSDVETGYITMADRFLMLALLMVGTYVNTIAPRMAEHAATGDRAGMQRYMSRSYTALTLGMIPFAMMFALAGPALARWLPDYEPVGLLLLVMAPFLIIKAWGGLAMSGALIPGGEARLALGIGIFGSAANLAFNAALVPMLGAYGSVLGMIASHSLVSAVVIYYVKRRMGLEFRFGGLR